MQYSRTDLFSHVNSFPCSPGVYIMRSSNGLPLYIGKAKDLRSRVRSYFLASNIDRFQIPALMRQVASIDWIATENETEALILEANLVRIHKPKFNIELRDDKHYPYLKITLNEPFPRLIVCRRVANDGARYFGPYTDAMALRRMVRFAKETFKIRDCSLLLPLSRPRPCINFGIGKCSAPCCGKISTEEYRLNVYMLIDFLDGRRRVVIKQLHRLMNEASRRLEFEKAAQIRDQISLIRRGLSTNQSVDLRLPNADCDVFGFSDSMQQPCLAVLSFRQGLLTGKRHFLFSREAWQTGVENRDRLVVQFYGESAHEPPPMVILPPNSGFNTSLLTEWSLHRWDRRISFTIASRGRKAALLQLAEKNAMLHASSQANVAVSPPPAVIQELGRIFNLPRPPVVIEAFDISNLGHSFAVAAMVRFVNGNPHRPSYRRYRIRTVEGQNDCAMILEAVSRRLNRLCSEGSALPDLILVDGGKAQLNAALTALKNIPNPPAVVALAKKEEEIYSPFVAEPVRLAQTHPARRLAERIRDEVHRYANNYHRKLRSRLLCRSILESIEGVGPIRASRLLKRFGSLEALSQAPVEEIARSASLPHTLARCISSLLATRSQQTG